MLDVDKLYSELREFEAKREEAIQRSIKITRLSKSVIYSLIRGDMESAKKHIASMVNEVNALRELLSRYPMFHGNAHTGLQEYVEAVSLWYLLSEGRLPTREELGVDVMTYLFGIADVAGEISRKATEEMIRGDGTENARRYREILENLYLEMLKLEPRDYELRKKVDYISNTINWITEKIFYKSICK